MAISNNTWWVTDDPQTELDELTARGFTVDPNTGQIVEFSETHFAWYINNKYDIIYAPDKCFYYYKQGVWKKLDIDEFKTFMYEELQEPRFGVWKASREYNYIEAFRRELYISKPLDSYKHLIDLENGMLDINSGKLLPYEKEYYSTVRIPVEYNTTAKCPRFDTFCSEIFEGDRQRINVLQEWFGLLISTDINIQQALILNGTGANGKSLVTALLEELIGKENRSTAMLNQLSDNFSRASMCGKIANICTESDNGYFSSVYFKQMIAGDPVHAAHKYGLEFDYTPTLKFVFAMNTLPNTKDFTEGYYRRLCILHFSVFMEKDK